MIDEKIDKNIPIPFYYQLKKKLQYKIKNGEWKESQAIPSERELCNIFEVSRTTARQALNELVIEGVVHRIKGKGTYVAKRKINERFVLTASGFYEDMVSQGHNVNTVVLVQRLEKATDNICVSLNLPIGTKMIRIERVRYVDDEPVIIGNNWLVHNLCPEVINEDLSRGSLYCLLREKYGLVVASAKREIQAVQADEHRAKHLQIKEYAPLLLLKSTSFLKDGTPLEYMETFHRADRSGFTFEMAQT